MSTSGRIDCIVFLLSRFASMLELFKARRGPGLTRVNDRPQPGRCGPAYARVPPRWRCDVPLATLRGCGPARALDASRPAQTVPHPEPRNASSVAIIVMRNREDAEWIETMP